MIPDTVFTQAYIDFFLSLVSTFALPIPMLANTLLKTDNPTTPSFRYLIIIVSYVLIHH